MICLFASILLELPSWLEWTWLVSIMLITGIPHGATDHLIFWHKQKQAGKSTAWISFLVPYLLQIAMYAFLWWIFPALSLLIFLLLSFYHFGQSELYYLALPEGHIFKKILYLLWGAGIMGVLLLAHRAETLMYIEEVINQQQAAFVNDIDWRWMIAVWSLWLGGMLIAWQSQYLMWSELLREILVSSLLIACMIYCSLWVAFGLYFGLWHATKTIRTEIQMLDESSEARFSVKEWIRQALPFSLVSFVGILLLGAVWWFWGGDWHPVFLFFVA
ncbi:MAG: Brp/Blh family beta-carotene 15,15'-dioxygenase, partial [Bacteroidota bacterium]